MSSRLLKEGHGKGWLSERIDRGFEPFAARTRARSTPRSRRGPSCTSPGSCSPSSRSRSSCFARGARAERGQASYSGRSTCPRTRTLISSPVLGGGDSRISEHAGVQPQLSGHVPERRFRRHALKSWEDRERSVFPIQAEVNAKLSALTVCARRSSCTGLAERRVFSSIRGGSTADHDEILLFTDQLCRKARRAACSRSPDHGRPHRSGQEPTS